MLFSNIEIKAIETGLFGLDGGSMFGVVPKALWSRAYANGDEMNRIPLSSRPLYIGFGEKRILIDTGNGNKFSQKLATIYNIDLEHSNLHNALKNSNIDPSEITDVILTHLHFDHCGGSTMSFNGEIAPSLPNAKYYVQKEQWEWALNPTEKDRGSFMREDYEPLFANGVLELVDGGGELFPNIELMPLFGHTKAMQAVKININNQVFFYAADLFPTSAHINLPYILAYDNFPLTTLAEKKRILNLAVDENWVIVFEHDAFVKAGKVERKNGSFALSEKLDV